MKRIPLSSSLLVLTFSIVTVASAQFVSITEVGTPVIATFDTGLPSGAVNSNWVDGETFPGWYVYSTTLGGAPAQYRTTSGSSAGWVLYQQRANPDATDGALALQPRADVAGDMYAGWRIVNNTGSTVTEFTVSYVGEQWYGTTGGVRSLDFAFKVGATSLISGDWTSVIDLNFYSPQANLASSGSLNGTLPENSTVIGPITISGVTWEDGQELWLRWYYDGSTNVPHILALDDVAVMAIPEPSTLALGMITTALLLVRFRRRR